MPLGVEPDLSSVNQGDSADLYAYIFGPDSNPIAGDDITSVEWTVQLPDGTKVVEAGTIDPDGAGVLRFTDTDDVGEYIALARFTLDNGEVRSTRQDFSVIDPFNPPTPSATEVVAEATWTLLEDCFDSYEGGPWLRDKTLSYFNKDKVGFFVPFAMLDINSVQPMTELTLGDFTIVVEGGTEPDVANTSLPILAYGTLIQVIRHLMRSYVEQPQTLGAQIVYEDRRDYLQRWKLILDDLLPEYMRVLILWKRQFLNLGKSALLVHSKAGRLYGPGSTSFRLRNVGRGFIY